MGAVLFCECSEGTLIISGVVENIPHMCVTDGAGEVCTEAFWDRRNGVPGVTLSHYGGSTPQPCDYTGFRKDGVGRRSASGFTNDRKDVGEAKEFTGR